MSSTENNWEDGLGMHDMKSVYVAGPMSWLKAFNFPYFDHASEDLRRRFPGLEVISPAELDDPVERARALNSEYGQPQADKSDTSWADFLRRDLKIVTEVDGIVALQGFTASSGADLETFVGRSLEIPTFYYPFLNYVTYACRRCERDEAYAHRAGGWLECHYCGAKMQAMDGEHAYASAIKAQQRDNKAAVRKCVDLLNITPLPFAEGLTPEMV